MKKKSFYLLTLGCPKNETDSDLVVTSLLRQGFKQAEKPEEARVVIVNTCAFLAAAAEESIEAILDLASVRAEGAGLYVIGCLQQRYGADLPRLLPEVDGFLAPEDYDSLAAMIEAGGGGQWAGRPPSPRDSGSREYFTGVERGRAYIKIAEGCDRCCTFCTIPLIKGPLRSRPAGEVAGEAAAAIGAGAKELVLVSQDTASYGRDLGKSQALAELLEGLAEMTGEYRIRLMYMQPDGIDDRLLRALNHDRICSYLDLPLQHVDEKVLRHMGRRGGAADYRELIARIRQGVPGIALRSSFITGFPGEDRASFERLCAFVEEVRFDWLAVFPFSPEEGTKAAELPGRCTEKTARNRAEALRELQEEIMRDNAAGLVGNTLEVLIEGPSDVAPGFFEARSYREAPEVDGMIYLPGGQAGRAPRFTRVRIVEAEGIDLIGETVG